MTTVAMSALPKVLQRTQEGAMKAIIRGLRSGAMAGRRHLVSVTPKDRGMAKAAWKEYDHNGSSGPVATVENSAPYIGILEMGSRPHAVSEEGQRAIYEWVLRNLRAVGSKTEGFTAVHGNDLHPGQRSRKLTAIDQGETLAKQITFLICRKIRREGSKPRYFVRDSMELLTKMAQGEVERCLREFSERGGAR